MTSAQTLGSSTSGEQVMWKQFPPIIWKVSVAFMDNVSSGLHLQWQGISLDINILFLLKYFLRVLKCDRYVDTSFTKGAPFHVVARLSSFGLCSHHYASPSGDQEGFYTGESQDTSYKQCIGAETDTRDLETLLVLI